MSIPARPFRTKLGVALFFAGVVSFVVFLVVSLAGILGGIQRVETPGRRELALEPGEYTVYWETQGRFQRKAALGELDLTVVPKDSGAGITLVASGPWKVSYSAADRFGMSIASFKVATSGTYLVQVAAAKGKTLPEGGIALDRAMGFFPILKIVGICILLLGAGVGGGVAVLLTGRKA